MKLSDDHRTVVIARWAGRALGLLLIVLIGVLAIGHFGHVQQAVPGAVATPLRDASLGAALFAMIAGSLIAWKWEGFGALAIFGGFAAFAIINGTRTFLPSPVSAFAVAGLLMAFCAWRSKRSRAASSDASS